MYKLLVADDEQIMIDSIEFIVKKNFHNIKLISAKTGREAIEKAEEFMPNIVFMDIKMPGINGIEAIREIKERNRDAKFIVLTAYEQFEIAKEALKLNVNDYLTKPVSKDKIIKSIKNMIECIEEDKEKRKKELDMKEKFEKVIPVLEYGFIYSLMLFDDNKNELENYKKIFEINQGGGYIITVEFGETELSGNMKNKIGVSVKSQSFYPHFRYIIKNILNCVIGPIMLNKIVIFVPTEIEKNEYEQRLEIIKSVENVYKQILSSLGSEVDFRIGIGRIYNCIGEVHRSYEESVRAIKYSKGKGVIHISDVLLEASNDNEYLADLNSILYEKIQAGDVKVSIKLFCDMFEKLSLNYSNDLCYLKNKVTEIMVLIYSLAHNYKIDCIHDYISSDYMNEIRNFEAIDQLKIWTINKIKVILTAINEAKRKNLNNLIVRSQKYILNNFGKEITLEEVAREVNISPYYFCKLFKEETGENFIEYLTSVRIQKAKGLLEEGKMSIKEICYYIGYGDPNYFSRIFKKIEGITPTEYKESNTLKIKYEVQLK